MKISSPPINIIVVNYVSAISERLVRAVAEIPGVAHIELIDVTPPPQLSDVSINYYDANTLHYGHYNVLGERLEVLEPAVIDEMAPYEAECLRMLDRGRKPGKIIQENVRRIRDDRPVLDFLSDDLSFDERRRIYLRHLRHWNHVIRKRNISFFFSINAPHIVYDYVAYALCRRRNIGTLYFDRPLYKGFVVPREAVDKLPRIEITQRRRDSRGPAHSPLSSIGEDFLRDQLRREESPDTPPPIGYGYVSSKEMSRVLYPYDRTSLLWHVLRGLFRRIVRGRRNVFIEEYAMWRTQARFFAKGLALDRYAESLARPQAEGVPYIYLPLHYQPESSTSPTAGQFVEQFLIIELLAAAIPEGFEVVVKEHPAQTCISRDAEYYRDIVALPNVRLVSRREDTYRLMRGAVAVATVSGTAGWEALIRAKPILVFGNSVMALAPGAFRIHSLQECKKALERISRGENCPTFESTRGFLAQLENASVLAYLDDAVPPELHAATGLTEDISVRNIVAELRQRLESRERTFAEVRERK